MFTSYGDFFFSNAVRSWLEPVDTTTCDGLKLKTRCQGEGGGCLFVCLVSMEIRTSHQNSRKIKTHVHLLITVFINSYAAVTGQYPGAVNKYVNSSHKQDSLCCISA